MSSTISSDSGSSQGRARKQNSLLQDEPQYRFDEKGYKVPIEPAAPPPPSSKSKVKPPLPPKKTAEAPNRVEVDPTPIAARDLPPPDGTGDPKKKNANEPKRYQIHWTDERDELLLDMVVKFKALEGKKMTERFQEIADELFTLEPFKDFTVVKGETIQKRFTDMKKDALRLGGYLMRAPICRACRRSTPIRGRAGRRSSTQCFLRKRSKGKVRR